MERWTKEAVAWNYDTLHPNEDPHTPFEEGGGVARTGRRGSALGESLLVGVTIDRMV